MTDMANGPYKKKRFPGISKWKSEHPELFEFILFNIMCNVATITNFLVLWLSSSYFFKAFSDRNFSWFIFEYSIENSGLNGFLSFLLAYTCAQIVNFIVQRKVVFGANNSVGKVLPIYVATVAVAGVISVWLPPYVIALTQPYLGGFAKIFANGVNIFIQVLINYPMMKFVIMKKK